MVHYPNQNTTLFTTFVGQNIINECAVSFYGHLLTSFLTVVLATIGTYFIDMLMVQ